MRTGTPLRILQNETPHPPYPAWRGLAQPYDQSKPNRLLNPKLSPKPSILN